MIESKLDSKESLQKANTNTWQEVKLGEVAFFQNGKAYAKEIGKYPIYGGNGIFGYTNRFNQTGENIIIGRVGAYCGSTFYTNGDIWVSDNAIIAKPKKNYNTRFLYYFLKNLDLNFHAQGSSQPLLTQSLLKSLEINFCINVETQRKIAEILSSLDDKIDLLHKQNQSLESLAQTLFEYHFIHNAKAEWKEKPLGEIAEIGIGRTPPRKEKQYFSTNNQDMQWISIKDMGDNGIFILNTAEYLTHEAVEKFNIPIIPKNSVLLSFKMTLGRVAITSCDMLSNEAIAHFKLKQDSIITKEYLYLFLKTFRYETLGSTSSIVTAINSTMIKALLIKIPNVNEIKEFQTKIENLFSKIYQNSKQIESLKSLRDIMLPKLLNGEIGVR